MKTLTDEEKELRDRCAIAAMQATLGNDRMRDHIDAVTNSQKELNQNIAESCYYLADAMLEQRKKPIAQQ